MVQRPFDVRQALGAGASALGPNAVDDVFRAASIVGPVTGRDARDTVTPQTVRDVLLDVVAAKVHRVDPRAALNHAQQVLGALHDTQRRATDSARRGALLSLVDRMLAMLQAQLPPLQTASASPAAAAQLARIAQASGEATRSKSVEGPQVHSTHNAVLGPVLHTGDEIWAASAHVIRQAQSSVLLQTSAYHRRSESARSIWAIRGSSLWASKTPLTQAASALRPSIKMPRSFWPGRAVF